LDAPFWVEQVFPAAADGIADDVFLAVAGIRGGGIVHHGMKPSQRRAALDVEQRAVRDIAEARGPGTVPAIGGGPGEGGCARIEPVAIDLLVAGLALVADQPIGRELII